MNNDPMSQDDYDRLLRYLSMLAGHLGLRDWILGVNYIPCADHAQGHAEITYGRKHLMVQVSYDFMRFNRDVQRHTCVHELLHAHFEPLQRALQNADEVIKKYWFQVTMEQHRTALETCVDTMAHILAPYLPYFDDPVLDEPPVT